MTPTPITLYPKRSQKVVLLLGSAAFTAGGVWMGSSGEWVGYLIAAFFALGIPIFLIEMLPGSGSLHINESGITFSTLFRKVSLAWSDIHEFYVVTLRHHGLRAHEMVGIDFAPGYDRARKARAFARFIAGCEGALPDTYGKKAADLAQLLNARLQQARTEAAT